MSIVEIKFRVEEEILIRIASDNLAAHKGYVSHNLFRFSGEGSIGSCQTLRFVLVCMALQKCLERGECWISKRKPGEFITGLNLFDGDFRFYVKQWLS